MIPIMMVMMMMMMTLMMIVIIMMGFVMREHIQPKAAQGAESVSVNHDRKAVTYRYATETL